MKGMYFYVLWAMVKNYFSKFQSPYYSIAWEDARILTKVTAQDIDLTNQTRA